ncbi:MAG: enamine deaminase RidA (YjgF/YER057c/UK114 family) [Acidimicrobiales bacterium]|jgi:enamine deaminase RidA (YjgF/YER057c/UK114 family)
MLHETVTPAGWAPAKGYANGVIATGRALYLGGQIGWNAEQAFETDDFIGQMTQTLENIKAILVAAGGGPEHLTRLTWFVTDKAEYAANQRQVGQAYRAVLGNNFPAMSLLVVADLLEDRAKIEIEATAVLPT